MLPLRLCFIALLVVMSQRISHGHTLPYTMTFEPSLALEPTTDSGLVDEDGSIADEFNSTLEHELEKRSVSDSDQCLVIKDQRDRVLKTQGFWPGAVATFANGARMKDLKLKVISPHMTSMAGCCGSSVVKLAVYGTNHYLSSECGFTLRLLKKPSDGMIPPHGHFFLEQTVNRVTVRIRTMPSTGSASFGCYLTRNPRNLNVQGSMITDEPATTLAYTSVTVGNLNYDFKLELITC